LPSKAGLGSFHNQKAVVVINLVEVNREAEFGYDRRKRIDTGYYSY
jgi:hypothetical protein